jgi:hypothetical protein
VRHSFSIERCCKVGAAHRISDFEPKSLRYGPGESSESYRALRLVGESLIWRRLRTSSTRRRGLPSVTSGASQNRDVCAMGAPHWCS